MKMEPIESSETSAFKTQTPGKYPKENILHKEHGESLKSRKQQDIIRMYMASCKVPIISQILNLNSDRF